jgi:hypothetical protein
MTTVHVTLAPAQAPAHPTKPERESEVAVSFTKLPFAYVALHVSPQEISFGTSLTEPPPDRVI